MIQNSAEYHGLEVERLYRQLLHRAADSVGLMNFTAFLAHGGTVEEAAALIAGSDEYWQQRGGGTTSGFLVALYRDGLGRTIDPSGQNAFSNAMAAGMSRRQAASAAAAARS